MHHQYVQYRLETVTSAVVLDLRCAGNKVLKPVGRHVSTVHVCCLPGQIIKTVHPMCCVPSSVDTLSGLHSSPSWSLPSISFFLSSAQPPSYQPLCAALQIYTAVIYRQGPSLTSRASAHDWTYVLSPAAPQSLGREKETLVNMYTSGKPLVSFLGGMARHQVLPSTQLVQSCHVPRSVA